MKFLKQKTRAGLKSAVLVLTTATVLAGCDPFKVTNPGVILDDDLNTVRGVIALVTGMSSDFSEGYDGSAFAVARIADEMAGSGSYASTNDFRVGRMDNDDANGYWSDMQRARWVAESGLERMRGIDGYEFNGNELTSRAYLFAGLSNRWFGEMFCQVIYDSGEPQPKSVAFQRALPQLDSAILHGNQAGRTDYVTAARGALAQAHVGLGNWSQAAQYAEQVPTDFVYYAVYSNNSGREQNEIQIETFGRYEMSAYDTWAEQAYMISPGEDPRTPWTDCRESPLCNNAQGADGITPHLRQEKYPDLGSDIPAVKGTEMRLIEAEAILQGGGSNLGAFADLINEVREFHGLAPIDTPTSVGEITGDYFGTSAWEILDRERFLTLWLEGRRLFDLHRWDHPFLDGGSVAGYVPPQGRRISCMPIADSECQTNPNVSCG